MDVLPERFFNFRKNISKSTPATPNFKNHPLSSKRFRGFFQRVRKTGKVRIKIKSSELLGSSYALAIRISAASQGEVSRLRKIFIVELKVKNAYEADYDSEGLRTNYGEPSTAAPITGTFPWTFVKTLSTVNANTCELETADGVDLMYLTVNPDTTVTISDSPNGGFATSNHGPCTYNTATRTFTHNYKYFNSSGNLRRMQEVLVKK